MLEISGWSLRRGRSISTAFLLFCSFMLIACTAGDPVPETPVSTTSVLIPLVEQGEAATTEITEVVPVEQAEPATSEIDCTSPAPLTPSLAEGPYYTPDTPERTSLLEPDMGGTRLTLTGYVLTTDCQPISNAWLDFWQADDQGAYDNAGYRLRGHQFTDENGRYQLETIIPGEYPGRPPHIHVKVQAPEGPVLTTQLYFPGSSGNENDPLFSAETLLNLQESENGFLSEFNFVVEK